MLRINNIKIRQNISDENLIKHVCKKYHINFSDIVNWKIFKKSIDARKKNDIFFNYTLDIFVKDENKYHKFEKIHPIDIEKIIKEKLDFNVIKSLKSEHSPVIVGSGPAGLFSALTLVQNGISPIIIEQGKKVDDRKKDIDNLLKNRILNTSSNVQFGEGGAGTFSDGKLTTGINNPLCKKVLQEFVNFGAPQEILYLSKPHIGTDNLINILKSMRNYIISKGGKFYFNTKFIDFESTNNKITSVKLHDLVNDSIFTIPTSRLILAIGHSSRDTFELLYKNGLQLEKKNFSVGVRVEHSQTDINIAQYGNSTHLKLPPAEYKLSYHSPSGRSCYTFCMCPGGSVMASSSDKNTIVTNGMSNFARNGKNANSALLVNVTPDDFNDSSPLAGIYFQQNLEEKAFKLGGSNYNAPIQRIEDFLQNKASSKIGNIVPSYLPGTTLSNLNDILPSFVSTTLKEGILYFDKKLSGFANPDAILTGVETRSSSPVKIIRNSSFLSNIDGIYPCGEGAGYAGGIMSAAVDGIKISLSILGNSTKTNRKALIIYTNFDFSSI